MFPAAVACRSVAGRDDLTDEQWDLIEPLMPSSGRGGQWRNHRQVIDGILWQLRTGAPWRDVPERYGPWKTLHERLRRWTAGGTWDRILEHVQTLQADAGRIEWVFSIDSSVVRAHQHSAGARKKGHPGRPVEDLVEPDEALGRTRGGLSTKIHLATDARGLPVVVLLTSGQAGDNPQLLRLLDRVRVNTSGPGRPRKRPDCVLAYRAYSSPSTRRALRARRIRFVSPEKKDHAAHQLRKGSRGGRAPVFDKVAYKGRNVVERCFNRLKQFRGLATRYAKRAAYYRALVVIAAIALWLR
ncbi:IS5 family transposase [Streptomyces sp. B226SN101]|uniref:IS5 family transposase n=1 Tax=unclassified Streptomyces TaxID=2593676 RepID=UPI0035BC7EBF